MENDVFEFTADVDRSAASFMPALEELEVVFGPVDAPADVILESVVLTNAVVDLAVDVPVVEPSVWDVPGVTVDLNGHSVGEWRAFVNSYGGPEGFFMAATGSIWNENGWMTGSAGALTFYGTDGGFSFDAH